MKARELMIRCPDVVTPDDSITAAAELMHYSDDACIPVVRTTADRMLVGVITARDIVVRCVARHHASACLVRDHMTPTPLHTLSPDDDVRDAARLMCEWEIRRIPVVTAGDVLVGVLHEPDLRRALERTETHVPAYGRAMESDIPSLRTTPRPGATREPVDLPTSR
jgi:CBS domain-containing protein